MFAPSDLRANPMAFGAWSQPPWLIVLGLPVIIVAWFTVRRSKSVI